MKMRDEMAARALAGLLAGVYKKEILTHIAELAEENGVSATLFISRIAYEYADCMMIAREEKNNVR